MTLRVFVYAWVATVAMSALPARAAVGAGAPTHQGRLPANILGPRKVATTPDGEMFVVDVAGKLHRLTARGELVGTVLDGVTAVAAAPGVVFAGLKDGAVVQVNPRTGRVMRRVPLGSSEAPTALAWDQARGKLWIAFGSGMLRAVTLDGQRVHDILPRPGIYRLGGVAVDPAGTVWVVQDRSGLGGTLHAYDAATGAYVRSVAVPVRIAGGVSVGAGGRVYVSDMFAGTVVVLERNGTAAETVRAPGEGLKQPAAVSFLANGDLVVASLDANRLDRFGGGAPPACPGDADCDGLPDAWEIAHGLDPNDPTNALADRDGDGLNDSEELAFGSDPRKVDSDGDGFADGEEVTSGFDPGNADDHRPQVLAEAATTDPGLVRLAATVHDPIRNRGACSTQWRQTSGARVTLSGATGLEPTFIARAAGIYSFEAVARCGDAASLPKQVDVTVRNVAPRADGGRVIAIAPGGRVQLSGGFSADANADVLAFQWDQLAGAPVAGSTAGRSLDAQFQAPGYYVFRLGATDAKGVEGAAEVPVLVLGDVPVPTAAASSPVLAQAGSQVLLDASPSYRGPAATFAWTQTAGAAVALDGATSATASFVPPSAGRFAFEVSVSEGAMRSPPARVEVFAAPEGGALPVAQVAAPAVAEVGVPVSLDGTASAAGTGIALTYAWRQVSGPAAGLTLADRAAATAVLFEPGSYEFELSVADAAAEGLPVRVRIEGRSRAKTLPAAVAKANATAQVGDLVLLDGSASTGAKTHRWTQVEGPWVVVEQGAIATFRPLTAGLYGFELEVDDGTVRSAPARVNVVVFPNGTEN